MAFERLTEKKNFGQKHSMPGPNRELKLQRDRDKNDLNIRTKHTGKEEKNMTSK